MHDATRRISADVVITSRFAEIVIEVFDLASLWLVGLGVRTQGAELPRDSFNDSPNGVQRNYGVQCTVACR